SLRAGYDGEPYCSRCGTDRFTDECVDLAVPNPVTPPE
ncbi:MAG: hypothetical protein RLZZ01_1300, partial [Actinomycetota bacterium]